MLEHAAIQVIFPSILALQSFTSQEKDSCNQLKRPIKMSYQLLTITMTGGYTFLLLQLQSQVYPVTNLKIHLLPFPISCLFHLFCAHIRLARNSSIMAFLSCSCSKLSTHVDTLQSE